MTSRGHSEASGAVNPAVFKVLEDVSSKIYLQKMNLKGRDHVSNAVCQLCCMKLQCLHFSESSMYLPVTPIKSKHRRSLNLLEVPHPQLGPHVKPDKVSMFTYFRINLCHPL